MQWNTTSATISKIAKRVKAGVYSVCQRCKHPLFGCTELMGGFHPFNSPADRAGA